MGSQYSPSVYPEETIDLSCFWPCFLSVSPSLTPEPCRRCDPANSVWHGGACCPFLRGCVGRAGVAWVVVVGCHGVVNLIPSFPQHDLFLVALIGHSNTIILHNNLNVCIISA